MTFKAKAIPTLYNGVQFRSRLEARWAAMFDLLKWKWEYEPIDLNGYIPDFLVTPQDDAILFEVKPIVGSTCPVIGCDCGKGDPDSKSSMDEAIRSIQSSSWTGPAVVAGACLPGPGQKKVTRLATAIESKRGSGNWFDTPSVVAQCRRCPAFVFEPDVEDYGVLHCCERTSVPVDPTSMWRQAGNLVQWKSPAKHRAPQTQNAQIVPREEVRAMYRAFLEEVEGD